MLAWASVTTVVLSGPTRTERAVSIAAGTQVYEKRRVVAEQEIELSMAEARLRVDGLEAALEQWEERERLKKLRQSLVDHKSYLGAVTGEKLTWTTNEGRAAAAWVSVSSWHLAAFRCSSQ